MVADDIRWSRGGAGGEEQSIAPSLLLSALPDVKVP
jgi:hypothetical protein